MSRSSWGRSAHTSSPNGRTRGRGIHQYSSLSSHDLGDEIPLMSADETQGGGEEEEWESSPLIKGGGGGGGGTPYPPLDQSLEGV